MLKFQSKLSMEEIAENFKEFNLFDELVKALNEAIEYEKHNKKTV